MTQKIIGELFGVDVHSPIIRSEVREIVKRQLSFQSEIESSQNLTDEQLRLEIVDIFNIFFGGISEEDKSVFEKMHVEEVNAAPKEWFSHEKTTPRSVEVKNGEVGCLYDIPVKYPFTRDNIRAIVQARSNLMNFMASTQGISLYQASNDLSDEQHLFLSRFDLDDQEKFMVLMTEELIAHTNALNDETAKINQQAFKQEVENQYYTEVIGGIVVFLCLMFLFFVVFK